MINNQKPKRIFQLVLLALLSVGVICILISLSIRLTNINEAKKLPVEQLLQQYWLEQNAQAATSTQAGQGIELIPDSGVVQDKEAMQDGGVVQDNEAMPDNGAIQNNETQQANEPDVHEIAVSDESVRQADDSKIDVNTATAQQLQQLKGIGPSKAQAIVDDREQEVWGAY